MTLNEYQNAAARTMDYTHSDAWKERHALLEMCSELGEIQSVYQKHMQGHPFDKDNLIEEIGDLLWGICELCTVNNIWLDDVAVANIVKLKKRYPNGFSSERSLNRGDR